MAILAQRDFRVVVPESSINPDAADFEFMLVWYNTDGGFYSWLFTDWIKREEINGETINAKTQPSKIFASAERTTQLIAEDLTENEFDVIVRIIRSQNIWRIFRTSLEKTPMKLAILTDSVQKRKTNGRYNITIEVQEQSPILIN